MRDDSAREAIPRQGVLLVNANSRRGTEWYELVRQRLLSDGFALGASRAFRNPRDLPAAVDQCIRNEVPLIIVGGGDGTIGSVSHLFAHRTTVLGLVPLGTGNAFARDLGIPPTIEGACDTLLWGKIAKVDMGIIEDRRFVNIATIGLSTRIARGLNDRSKKVFGKTVYLASVLKGLATVKPFRVKLELPDGIHEFDSLQVVIGNGRLYAGPFRLAPDASITGGWLSIYALASQDKRSFLKLVLHMVAGGAISQDQIQTYRVQSGTLTTDPPMRVTLDGEVCLTTPVKFGISPRALRVAVPQDFDSGR